MQKGAQRTIHLIDYILEYQNDTFNTELIPSEN